MLFSFKPGSWRVQSCFVILDIYNIVFFSVHVCLCYWVVFLHLLSDCNINEWLSRLCECCENTILYTVRKNLLFIVFLWTLAVHEWHTDGQSMDWLKYLQLWETALVWETFTHVRYTRNRTSVGDLHTCEAHKKTTSVGDLRTCDAHDKLH